MSEKIRDSFIFYRSFYQSAKKLPKEDKAELFDAICSYALDGESVEMSVVPEAIFTVIKPNLDANRRKWENGCKEKKKHSENEADEEQEISKDEAKDKQTTSKPQGNVDVNVDVDKDVKSKSELESQFESFWEFYIPVKTKDGFVRKGSKEQSKIAFAKALKKNSFEKIMAALESYLTYCQQNNRFTKNASSWLNEGDFEITDETCIIAKQPKAKDQLNLIREDF